MKIYFAADHAGFDLKNKLINFVRGELGHEVEDCGAFELDTNDDYPDVVASAARSIVRDIRDGIECRGIILGASGQGEAIAANRFAGIRAAVYYGPAGVQHDESGHDFDMLQSVRAHNDTNVLSLGARFVTEDAAKQAVREWLSADFAGDDRHVRRIAKLDMLGTTDI
jgi:ribose 5-phosphate isomerase B